MPGTPVSFFLELYFANHRHTFVVLTMLVICCVIDVSHIGWRCIVDTSSVGYGDNDSYCNKPIVDTTRVIGNR